MSTGQMRAIRVIATRFAYVNAGALVGNALAYWVLDIPIAKIILAGMFQSVTIWTCWAVLLFPPIE